ncbi:epimerase [Fulvivirgaceae bacterium BMA10]|uniref:Epimerase n=1 Tax=Splendidivirga corallicola TaxID=3051826 RepID=A0ABT8KRQ4_9BACT|nr:epimerase [Fulvivirgaceae bacterium BMA10]
MKVIITGTTGMVGKGVLLECLDHSDITEVLSISRKPIEIEHSKLKELIHQDFSEFASVADQLKGYDACYACMGVSAAGLKEEQYTKLTHTFTLSLAKELLILNKDMTFNYVSGEGTDSSEKGRGMWARVKGKTENDLLNLGFAQAFMFRPGAIIPLRGVEPSSKLYKFLIRYLKWLIKLIKMIAPKAVVDTTQIGLAMINVTKNGYDKRVLKPYDIQILAG